MKLSKIQLWNIGSHKYTSFDLANQGLSLIFGDVGAGKSTIFKTGIVYALFDRLEKDVKIEDIVNWNNPEKDGKIVLIIEDDLGTFYKIRKIVSKKGNSTNISWIGSNEETQHWTSTEHKEKIRSLVNCDYETFVNSQYIRQGQITKLISGSKAERNDIFSKFQDIPILEKAKNIHKEDFINDKNEVNLLDLKVNTLNSTIAALKPRHIKNNISNTKLKIAEIHSKIEDAKRNSIRVKNVVDRMQSDSKEYFRLKSEIDSKQNELLGTEEAVNQLIHEKQLAEEMIPQLIETARQKSIDALKTHDLIENKNREKQNCGILKENLKSEKELSSKYSGFILKCEKYLIHLKSLISQKLSKKNAILDKGECSECEQDISEEHKENVKSKIDKEVEELRLKTEEYTYKRKTLKVKKNDTDIEIEKLQTKINEIESSSDLSFLFIKASREERERKDAENELETQQDLVDKNRNLILKLQSNLKVLRKQKESTDKEFSSVESSCDEEKLNIMMNKHYKSLQELAELETKKVNFENYLLDQHLSLGRIKKLRVKREETKDKKLKLLEKIRYHEAISYVFSKTGLRIHKIESMIDSVNAHIASFQSYFSNSKILSSEFVIDESGKIDIIVWIKGLDKPKPISLLSGGETEIVSFPTILGLFAYIAGRNYSNVLFIDEGIVYLDSNLKSCMSELLNEIKEKGINIFIISHDEVIKDFDYDHIIEVKEVDGYSKLEKVK